MCNGTWVCFDCRTAVRRPTWRHVTAARPWLIGYSDGGWARCPKCREPCQFLGPTIEIPARLDARAWKRLRSKVTSNRLSSLDAHLKKTVRRRHDLEQRIRDLQSRPKSPGREKPIKSLREKLAAAG